MVADTAMADENRHVAPGVSHLADIQGNQLVSYQSHASANHEQASAAQREIIGRDDTDSTGE